MEADSTIDAVRKATSLEEVLADRIAQQATRMAEERIKEMVRIVEFDPDEVFGLREIFQEHSVDRPFLSKHYKQALQNLQAQGVVEALPKPRKNSFADHISVSFPAHSR